jgi:hypothetical protein
MCFKVPLLFDLPSDLTKDYDFYLKHFSDTVSTHTPWCRILFEKLIVTQLVKKYPAFLQNPKFHRRAHKSPPPDPILSQPNSVRPIDPYLPKVQLNDIGLGAFAASELDKVFSGYQPR